MMLKKIVLASTVFLFSCGDKNGIPPGIIKPAKMQLVLFDILRADAFVFDFVKKDSTKNVETESVKLQQQIFAVHKISRKAFYKSYDFYKAHPGLMQSLLDSMINRATRDKYMNTKSGNVGSTPVLPAQADTSTGKAMREKYATNRLATIAGTSVKGKLLQRKTKRLKRTLKIKKYE
jgi:Domain of unknown function (DUF4296)